MTEPHFAFDNSYQRELNGLYAPWQGADLPGAQLLKLNEPLARELGLDPGQLRGEAGVAALAGSRAPAGAEPLAMVYAGHQFGGYSPQLGDGRALLLGELVDVHGRRRDLHLKGSGRTPFSRNGDGKAALQPVLREYLIGEAMHALGVPTTRALAAVLSGERVAREGYPPGAVLARVAASHLRVGTFQYAASTGDLALLQRLADYTIARHYPSLHEDDSPYLGLLRGVGEAQAVLVARWMALGFVHGVMNTDNVALSGETIDYGPCAFIDRYADNTVFSSIDSGGRYAYARQPDIAQWNLARFAETLLRLIDPESPERAVAPATAVIEGFADSYQSAWLREMRAKLGLSVEADGDAALVSELLEALQRGAVDFTGFFRALSAWVRGGDDANFQALAEPGVLDAWLGRYRERLAQEPLDDACRAAAMERVNPVYIPRNHRVEEALQAAEGGDMAPFDRLLAVLGQPFTEQTGAEDYTGPAPADAGRYVTYCGT